MINTRHWVNRKYFLQASSISVHAEQGGDSKTGLLLVIWLVNSARKENTLYFKSQHTQPAHSAQKRSTGVSGPAKRDYWRRRSCMKNPGIRSRSRKCSCLVCMQLPASCCALRSSYLQKHSLPPSCLTTFLGEGCKCVQNPWRSFHGRHWVLNTLKRGAGRNHFNQNAKPNKNFPVDPYPCSPSGRLWDLTLVMRSHPACHAHPPHQTYSHGCAESIT